MTSLSLPSGLRFSTLYSKFFFLTVGVCFALVVSLLLFIDIANQHFAESQIESELATGERVTLEALANDQQQYSQAVAVLANDFGLRDAITSGDVPTLVSALGNHAARIKAPLAAVVDLDSKVVASTLPEMAAGQVFPALALFTNLQSGAKSPATSGWFVIRGQATLLVAAPVKAPLLVGWVVLGFPINIDKVKQLSTLTGMELAFVSGQSSPASDTPLPLETSMQIKVDATSFASIDSLDLMQQLRRKIESFDQVSTAINGVKNQEITFNRENFLVTTTTLTEHTAEHLATQPDSENNAVILVLFKSLDDALAPYRKLRLQLLLMASVGLLVASVGCRLLTRTLTSPIASLVQGMREIGKGDYTHKVSVKTGDEVEQLASGFNAMSHAMAEREEQIRHQGSHDSLTGLPNYHQLSVHGDPLLEQLGLENKSAVLFKFDVNRFRLINESLGYEVGNQTLIAVAHRLGGWLRESDALARQGGNEFALLLPTLDPAKAQAMFQRFHEAFEQPVAVCGETIDIRFSAGCAFFPQHGKTVAELLQKAEIAMFIAKNNGAGVAFYDASLDANGRDKLTLLGELKQATQSDDELEIYLQPKVRLDSGKIIQAEALVRWNHPVRGFIPPSEFIPFAEQTGHITEVTRWMLDRVVALLVDWRQRHDWPLRISVNVSTRDLQDAHFPAYVQRLLERHQCPADALCIEVTETGLMDDPLTALASLNALHALGIMLSIDDFGTGYSSLAYLRKMPVRELKIDRSFVTGSETNSDAIALLRSTIDLGHNLGMSVVAEGVETEAEMQLLVSLGCDYVQGYLVAKPQSVLGFESWYLKNQTYTAAV